MSIFNTDEIRNIEKVVNSRNPEWYYHGFAFNEVRFTNMITDGIKCPFLTGRTKSEGYNGLFFISVSKIIPGSGESAFYSYLENRPMLIIDDIKTKKCYPSGCAPIPIIMRDSMWYDEYQAFFKISHKKIIGIECSVRNWLVREKIDYLKDVRDMIIILKNLGIDLPLYDYSHLHDREVLEVNKEEFLSLSKKLI